MGKVNTEIIVHESNKQPGSVYNLQHYTMTGQLYILCCLQEDCAIYKRTVVHLFCSEARKDIYVDVYP